MDSVAQGTDSPKRAYLDTFPNSHDCTLCWNDTEMNALKGMPRQPQENVLWMPTTPQCATENAKASMCCLPRDTTLP